jgi:mannose-6-phosphate isomerase
MKTTLYPLHFAPVYKDYIWGGQCFKTLFDRQDVPPVCAESWELTDRPEGMSVVTNGSLKDKTLHELNTAVTGRRTQFPLLVKLIDAHQRLSVQVHPDERAAAALDSEPKNEMWYVLNAVPGAQVFAGLKPGTRPAQVFAALNTNRIEDVMNVVPIVEGDCIFVPGGRVHSIDAGCVLLEVQQNSDTTYRLHDWGRLGANGRPRPLHIDQAFESIHWDDPTPLKTPPRALEKTRTVTRTGIMDCPFFRVDRFDFSGTLMLEQDAHSFQALFIWRGKVEIQTPGYTETFLPGTSVLLPAGLPACSLKPQKNATIIRSRPAAG